RPANAAADEIRIRHQHSNGASARHRGAVRASCYRRRGDRMIRRREFITLLGGATAWPLAARAQQQTKITRVGILGLASAAAVPYVNAVRAGLRDLGYIEGKPEAVPETHDQTGYADFLKGWHLRRREPARLGHHDIRLDQAIAHPRQGVPRKVAHEVDLT